MIFKRKLLVLNVVGLLGIVLWSNAAFSDNSPGSAQQGDGGEQAVAAHSLSAVEIARQRYSFKGFNDNMVIDHETGLEWMRCSIGQTWDTRNSVCQGNPSEYRWDEAMSLPQSINRSSEGFNGYTDWRLPTIDELRTMVYCSNLNPPFRQEGGVCPPGHRKPTVFIEAFPSTPATTVWSSSTYLNDPGRAWYVYFVNGHEYHWPKGGLLRVRLVRDR